MPCSASTESENILGSDEIEGASENSRTTSSFSKVFQPIDQNESHNGNDFEHAKTIPLYDLNGRCMLIFSMVLFFIIFCGLLIGFVFLQLYFYRMKLDNDKIISGYVGVFSNIQIMTSICPIWGIFGKTHGTSYDTPDFSKFTSNIERIMNRYLLPEYFESKYAKPVQVYKDYYIEMLSQTNETYAKLLTYANQCVPQITSLTDPTFSSTLEALRLASTNITSIQNEFQLRYFDEIEKRADKYPYLQARRTRCHGCCIMFVPLVRVLSDPVLSKGVL